MYAVGEGVHNPGEGEMGETHKVKSRVTALRQGDSEFETAKQLEFEVFEREGFAEDAKGTLKQYEPYDPNSIIFEATSPETGERQGVLRTIYAGEELDVPGVERSTGFKTLDDFELFDGAREAMSKLLENGAHKIVEVGTAAAEEKFRRTDVSDKLYRAAFLKALEDGKRYCIASIDTELLKKYRDGHMFNFIDIGPTKEKYMGGPTTPVFMDILSLPDYWAKHNPAFYRKMLGEDPKPQQ